MQHNEKRPRAARHVKPYFPHDADMRHDRKIRQLISEFGIEGYAWYCITLEILREEPNYQFKISPKNMRYLMDEYKMLSIPQVQKFLDFCVDEELLTEKDGIYTSESFKKRMEPVDSKIAQTVRAANTRWSKERERQKTYVEPKQAGDPEF